MSDGNTNLLLETLEILQANKKVVSDVRWIGVRTGSKAWPVGTWDEFQRLADFKYDAGYGGNNIAGGLVVVGDDWWLEPGEYDGSEWWEFKTLPTQPEEKYHLRREDLENQ